MTEELDARRGPSLRRVWGILFLFTCCCALLIQLIVIPVFLPGLDAGNGVLAGTDGEIYDRLARMHAEVIREEGWSHWALFPDSTPYISTDVAIVGIASAWYAAFVPEPWVLIPLNAALHATSGALLYWLLLNFASWPQALFGCGVVLFMPSAAQWYSQLMRDEYSVLGFLLFLCGWITYVQVIHKTLAGQMAGGYFRRLASGTLCVVASGACFLLGRPYLITVLVVLSELVVGLLLVSVIAYGTVAFVRHRGNTAGVIPSVVVCACLFASILVLNAYSDSSVLFDASTGHLGDADSSLSMMERAVLSTTNERDEIQADLASLYEQRTELEREERQLIASASSVGSATSSSQVSRVQRQRARTIDLIRSYESHVAGLDRSVRLAQEALESGKTYGELFATGSQWAQAFERVMRLQDRHNWLRNEQSQSGRREEEINDDLTDLDRALADTVRQLGQARVDVEAWGRLAGAGYGIWQPSWYLPGFVDSGIRGISNTRRAFTSEIRQGGSSGIDVDFEFANASDFFRYMPRATQIAFLAPFPDQWSGAGYRADSWLTRRITGAEMCVAYAAFACLLLFGRATVRKPEFWVVAFFSCTMLILSGASINVIGSLYRVRAPYFVVLVALGLSHLPLRIPWRRLGAIGGGRLGWMSRA